MPFESHDSSAAAQQRSICNLAAAGEDSDLMGLHLKYLIQMYSFWAFLNPLQDVHLLTVLSGSDTQQNPRERWIMPRPR